MSDGLPVDNHVALQLSNAIVGWFKERAGRGPTHTKAHIADDHALVLLRDVHTRVERTLVENGRADLVEELRHVLRGIHHDELCALVSRQLGRPVTTMLSDHDPATDTSALVFVFS
jgi:uncharacterized protein YbcI